MWCNSADRAFSTQTPDGCDVSTLRFVSDRDQATYADVPQTATLYGCFSQGTEGGPVSSLTSSAATFLGVCATVPFSDWTAATKFNAGNGRLTTPMYSIGGDRFARAETRSFLDSTLNIDCVADLASDGVLRCLPIGDGRVSYSDAACTSRVVLSSLPGAPLYAAEGSTLSYSSAVLGPVTIYRVGIPWSGPIFARTPAGCIGPSTNPGYTFEIGDVVPPSTFAAFELRTVP